MGAPSAKVPLNPNPRLVAANTSPSLAPINEPRYSESTPRFSDLADSEELVANGDGTAPRLQPPGGRGPEARVARAGFAAGPSTGDTPSLRRNRFSFMRLRHASDPQLSRSYAKAEETPPIPSLPRKCTHLSSERGACLAWFLHLGQAVGSDRACDLGIIPPRHVQLRN